MSRASCGVGSPHSGKQRRQPGSGHALLAVLPHVLQEQIAERDVREPVGDGARDSVRSRAS